MELSVRNFLAKKTYRQITLPSIRGASRAIEIEFKDYPVRVSDGLPQKRLEYYPDFNVYLMDAVWSAIGDYSQFAAPKCLTPSLRHSTSMG
jgi:hypothetical protein